MLATYGYEGSDRPLVTSVEAVPALSTAAWVRHLHRLGCAPDRVVTDGGRPVVGGAAKAWPGAERRRCEYHLARNLFDALPQRVRDDPQDELHAAARCAQRSVRDWDAYRNLLHARAAQATGFVGARARTGRFDALIRAQAATRSQVGPHSTGPLEHYFRNLETTIGDQAAKMTNKHRADALLQLLTAKHNAWVDEDAWTDLIRDHLVARKGHAIRQRLRTDPAGTPSLRV